MRKLLYLVPFLLFGCSMSQKVSYRTDNLPVSTQVNAIPISVEVRILADNRSKIKENDVLFTAPRQTKLDGKTMCINSEQHYKKDSVSAQMTRIMVEHFNKANLFAKSTYNTSNNSGYYLTGTINSFYGEQAFSSAALVGSQFGLIGALATAAIKTPGKIIIEVADIKLFKKDGALVKDLGNFYKEYNDDIKADGYCWCIYNNMNEKLKDFNTHLIDKIRTDLAEVKFDN